MLHEFFWGLRFVAWLKELFKISMTCLRITIKHASHIFQRVYCAYVYAFHLNELMNRIYWSFIKLVFLSGRVTSVDSSAGHGTNGCQINVITEFNATLSWQAVPYGCHLSGEAVLTSLVRELWRATAIFKRWPGYAPRQLAIVLDAQLTLHGLSRERGVWI